jgi:4-amino-4-deoxy-L-arabinose transferase-like glycosyltransferase
MADSVNTAESVNTRVRKTGGRARKGFGLELLVVLFAGVIFGSCIPRPPSLMDDVDAVHAQMARTMLVSGNWVTMRLDGIRYLAKAPFLYWTIATSYSIFGVHDWAARIPIVLAILLVCWLTTRFGMWAFDGRAGFYAGLSLATCIGLFLFTRILIPDIMLTGTIALSMWAFLRALEEEEPHPRLWALVLAASMGIGLLLKSLIAVVFPVGAALAYLFVTRQLFLRRTWKRLHVFTGLLVTLAVAAPWHILATLQNPPYWSWSLRSRPGVYHGFLWFYFINEQLLRFLGTRYPKDYNTVPRLWFWLMNLVWLFPWSVYLPAAVRLSYKPVDRAGRTRLLALCWIGFLMVFFSFSTTQEYYTMPIYPALALVIGSAMATDSKWLRYGSKFLSVVTAGAFAVLAALFYLVRNVPTPGTIARALTYNPQVYTLSLGHMDDLTVRSFAYMRPEMILAGMAFLLAAIAAWWYSSGHAMRTFLLVAVSMVIFFQAARMAMVVFDPYLSSWDLAQALLHAPPGKLIVDGQYYNFSALVFYSNQEPLLLNGRIVNIEYGSYAPDAQDHIFINDREFQKLWSTGQRYYIAADRRKIPSLDAMVGPSHLYVVEDSGGQLLLTNEPIPHRSLTTLQNQSPKRGPQVKAVANQLCSRQAGWLFLDRCFQPLPQDKDHAEAGTRRQSAGG